MSPILTRKQPKFIFEGGVGSLAQGSSTLGVREHMQHFIDIPTAQEKSCLPEVLQRRLAQHLQRRLEVFRCREPGDGQMRHGAVTCQGRDIRILGSNVGSHSSVNLWVDSGTNCQST